MQTIQIRRGIDETIVIRFIDSSDPPVPIDLSGSEISVILVCGETRLRRDTADGGVVFRDLFDPSAVDDPRAGVVGIELGVDETYALPPRSARLEVRRMIAGNVEPLGDIAAGVTDWTDTKGI